MRFLSLRQKINRTLVWLALVLFAVVACVSGILEYKKVGAEYSQRMAAKIAIARSLVVDTIFEYDLYVKNVTQSSTDKLFGDVLITIKDLLHLQNPGDTYYVLDAKGTVILVADEYYEYLGLDFSALLPGKDFGGQSVFYHQSLLTKRSVVSIQYTLSDGMRLVVERSLENIIPAMVHFEEGQLFHQELFFVLSATGQVVYHPDRTLIKSRHNLRFDMREKTEPDEDGYFSFSLHGREYVATREEISVLPGWSIYYAVPRAEMLTAIRGAVVSQIMLLIVIFATIFVSLQIILARFFTAPVSRIVSGLQRSHMSEGLFLTDSMAAGTLELKTIIDEIHNRDDAVARSTERFQMLLNSLDAAVYVADMETYEILFINSYGQKEWGDITGKICWQAIQKGQEGPCPFCTNHLLLDENGKATGVYIWEFQNTINDCWYECRDQAIRWTDGRLVRMEVAIDISQRKKAEEALLAEKEMLAVTLHSISDGVITIDVEGRIVLVNRVAEEIAGWQQKEAVGCPLEEIFHIKERKTGKPYTDQVARVLETGQVFTLFENTVLVDRSGRERIVVCSGAPIRDKNNHTVGVVLAFRDVAEENKLREEALKAKKLESVGVLAGGIAHDFNNILAAILGNIDLASHMIGKDHESYPILQMAEKASVRAKGLTHQLLTFAKGGDPVRETTSLIEVVRDSATFVLSGSNVSCSFDCSEDLWWADIDKGQISQVIQNIVINADQAMPEGGSIQVRCENVNLEEAGGLPLSAGKYVRISIADTGCGIEAESLTRIFDPYFSTKEIGQGLGLAIVRAIVQKHDGCIIADSEVGKGTTFCIYLPASESKKSKMEDLFIAAEPSGRKGRILIMDDEDMVREIVCNILQRLGYEILQAVDGTEALEIYQNARKSGHPVDLVIMDLTIPGAMGGKDAIKKLLESDSTARVIVSSGYANDPVMANFREYGFVAAVQKPFQMAELAWVVEQNIQKSSVDS